MCDASSYTTDAGGQPSLDSLFIFGDFEIQLATDPKTKVERLEAVLFETIAPTN